MKSSKKLNRFAGISLVIFLLTLILGAYALFFSRLRLVIRLNAGEALTLSYGEAYEEPGYRVFLEGSPLLQEPLEMDLPVEVQGTVPFDALGSFSLSYRAQKLWLKAEALRTVAVEDHEAPVITLVSGENPPFPYVEEGYRATDNADGDLTAQVVRKEYEGEIRYFVKDSSGNEAQAVRKVRTFDITPPEITLLGEAETFLPYGNPWQDPGCEAKDNTDGDLTAAVTVEGQVDAFLPGTYTLRYSVQDSSQNMAVRSRLVTVGKAPREPVILPERKTIYLTFDDGPGPYTDRLLDILKKYDVKATFFVVGTGHEREMRRIVEEGHSIAVHSVTHKYKEIYADEEAYFRDLLGMQQIIEDHTGVKTTLLRFPGGGSNLVSSFNKGIMSTLTEAVQDAGFQYFDWNVDSNDAGGARTWQEVYENVTEGCRGQKVSVVLQHDIHPFSVEAVESIILWGRDRGYDFQPLTRNSFGAHHTVLN